MITKTKPNQPKNGYRFLERLLGYFVLVVFLVGLLTQVALPNSFSYDDEPLEELLVLQKDGTDLSRDAELDSDLDDLKDAEWKVFLQPSSCVVLPFHNVILPFGWSSVSRLVFKALPPDLYDRPLYVLFHQWKSFPA